QIGGRLDAERLPARPERARGLWPIAPSDRTGGPRPRQSRGRGLGVDGHRNGSRFGEGSPFLEKGRRVPPLPDDDLQPPPPQAHPRPHGERPPRRTAPLPLGGCRPTLNELPAQSEIGPGQGALPCNALMSVKTSSRCAAPIRREPTSL